MNLKVKETIAKILSHMLCTRTNITPQNGANYATWGGSFYEVSNGMVHIHLALSGLTSTWVYQQIFVLPSGLRPRAQIQADGGGGTTRAHSMAMVSTSGSVGVYTDSAYAIVDVMYPIP